MEAVNRNETRVMALLEGDGKNGGEKPATLPSGAGLNGKIATGKSRKAVKICHGSATGAKRLLKTEGVVPSEVVANPAVTLVGDTGLEPVTPTMSR